MATTASKLTTTGLLTVHRTPPPSTTSIVKASSSLFTKSLNSSSRLWCYQPKRFYVSCKETKVSSSSSSSSSQAEEAPTVSKDNENWVPVVPLTALPKRERRVIIQGGETILLLWYKDDIFAIENKSIAEGAYTEGLLNAKLTQLIRMSRPQEPTGPFFHLEIPSK